MTKSGYIVVTNAPTPPTADFSGTPTSGTSPLNVAFSDLSTGDVTSWSWAFGDGATSASQNPSHTYASAGTFTVSLTVSGPAGSDTMTKSGYVTVSDPAPIADFSGTPTSGTAPLLVAFSDLSLGNVTSWSWTFGDGGTSTAQNPSHTYTTAGTYTVSMTATGPGGADTNTKTGYVIVSAAPVPPIADFSGTPTTGTAPLGVAFTDLSTGDVTSWSWTFGDGGTSTAQNPSHVYTTPGTYDVTLTATGPAGSDGETKVSYITVDPPAGSDKVYMTFTSTTTLPGVGKVRDEDIASYEPSTGTWSRVFDGSDVGVGGTDINAFAFLPDGSIVMSFNSSSFSIPGLTGGPEGTTVREQDLVRFIPATLGASTSGSWEFYFDGSDVGLTTSGEDIDAVHVGAGGEIYISTIGNPGVSGWSGLRDEDVLIFNPTSLGAATAGTWDLLYDMSDVGYGSSGEDTGAITFDANGDLMLATAGNFSVTGATGSDEDIVTFLATSSGVNTSGASDLIYDLSTLGIATNEDVDGLFFASAASGL